MWSVHSHVCLYSAIYDKVWQQDCKPCNWVLLIQQGNQAAVGQMSPFCRAVSFVSAVNPRDTVSTSAHSLKFRPWMKASSTPFGCMWMHAIITLLDTVTIHSTTPWTHSLWHHAYITHGRHSYICCTSQGLSQRLASSRHFLSQMYYRYRHSI